MSTVDQSTLTPGPMGWGLQEQTATEKHYSEKQGYDRLCMSDPGLILQRATRQEDPAMAQKLADLHKANGIDSGSWCSLIEDAVFGFRLAWVAQVVGSCVASGGMRAATRRCLIESFLLGDPEEIFGTKLVGTNNVAPFGPYSYRAGRKYAGINGNGDGSYCSAHTKGAADYGWLPCSAPGLVSDTFPEPQSASLYRQWGANDTLLEKFASVGRVFKLLETVLIKDRDTQKINLEQQKKPMMVCSNWAFRPKEPHPTWKLADGSPVWIYQRDNGTSWAHNMTKDGSVTVRGQEYTIVDNSWGPNAHKNGSWFAIPAEVDEKWIRDSEIQTIGELDMRDNSLVAA